LSTIYFGAVTMSLPAPSILARLPNQANRILERLRKADHERLLLARERFAQVKRLKDQRTQAENRRNKLAGFAEKGMLFRETHEWEGDNQDPTIQRVPDPQLQEVETEIARLQERIAALQAEQDPLCLTAARAEVLLAKIPANAEIEECTVAPKAVTADALARVRRSIVGKREERDQIARKNRTKVEMVEAARTQIRSMAARGQPKVRALLEGGNVEFPVTKLPKAGNFHHYVPDGAALVAYLFEAELIRKVESLIDFNASDKTALSADEKARQLEKLDAELMTLRREEAAIVEAIIADGGAAFHFADAPIEAVFSISVADMTF
jgi:hypothetical protein